MIVITTIIRTTISLTQDRFPGQPGVRIYRPSESTCTLLAYYMFMLKFQLISTNLITIFIHPSFTQGKKNINKDLIYVLSKGKQCLNQAGLVLLSELHNAAATWAPLPVPGARVPVEERSGETQTQAVTI